MKKLLLIIFLFASVAVKSQTEFTTLTDTTAVWKQLNERYLLSVRKNSFASAIQAPNPYHIPKQIIIIDAFENMDASIPEVGANNMNAYATKGAYFTNNDCNGHTSQVQYYELAFGKVMVTSNNDPGRGAFTDSCIFTEALRRGGFTAYCDGLKADGDLSFQWNTWYAKHAAFYGVKNLPLTCVKKLTSLPADLSTLPQLTLIVPDILNSGHNTNIQVADLWFATLKRIQDYALANDCILIIRFDESSVGASAGLRTWFAIAGKNIKKGRYNFHLDTYDHTNLISDLLQAPRLGVAALRTGYPFASIFTSDSVIVQPIDTTHHTTKCYRHFNDTTITYKIDTTKTITIKPDSVEVACVDTTHPTDTTKYFIVQFYEQYFNQSATDKVKADAMIRDHNRLGTTDIHCYDVNNAAPYNATNAQFTALIQRIKRECPKVRHVIECTTNALPRAGFDGVNNEAEPWAPTGYPAQDASWSTSKKLFLPISNEMFAEGKQAIWHFGWMNSPLMATECYKYLEKNTSYLMYHDYRKVPNDGYLKVRLDSTEHLGIDVDVFPYASWELAFAQNYPGTYMDWYNAFKIWFDAQHYKHIHLVGIGMFTRQLYDVTHPIPATFLQSIFKSKAVLNPVYNGFDKNTTTPSHLQYITE